MPRHAISVIVLTTALAMSAVAAAPSVIASGPGLSASIQPASTGGARLDRSGFRLGMVVVDRRGKRVGVIRDIRRSAGGERVRIDDSGSRFWVATRWLRPTRHCEKAMLLLSRSQIRTRAILNQ